jgi:hypothetical protein
MEMYSQEDSSITIYKDAKGVQNRQGTRRIQPGMLRGLERNPHTIFMHEQASKHASMHACMHAYAYMQFTPPAHSQAKRALP